MIGRTVSHYRILEKLGGGGMGVVYMADDTKLRRKVALKFLSPELTRDEDAKKRFVREAQAASALDHPNICVIHEIDETPDGDMFICMALCDGTTLKSRIEQAPLPVGEAIGIASKIAEALAKAHSEGIVHRDIKPANLMVTKDDAVKVVDFGLAKLAAGTRVTKAGTPVGTVAYMSPEQARGEEVDARTDVFSLGVVLYELLTAKLPFSADHEQAVIYKIMNVDPEPLAHHRKGLPPGLQPVIDKALAKDPGDRYKDAGALLEALRDLQGAEKPPSRRRDTGRRRGRLLAAAVVVVIAAVALTVQVTRRKGTAEPSIAVLPFVNLSTDDESDYFSDGFTEDVMHALAKTGIRVVARTSAFQFKGQAHDVREIGERLGVQMVLEGAVRKTDWGVVVTANLVNVSSGYQIWSKRFERELSDVFDLQREISTVIVDEMELGLSNEQRVDLVKRYTDDTEAYMQYLKGRYYWNIRSAEALKKAVEFFHRSIEEDPGYALAYAGLADAYLMGVNYGSYSPEEGYMRAKAAAMRAIALDAELAEAHASLALAKWIFDWDWLGAETEFKQAVALKSTYPTTHHWYALFLAFMGKSDEAVAEIKVALRMDPVSLIVNSAVALMWYCAEDYDAAIGQCNKTLDMDPDFYPALTVLGRAYSQKNQYEAAISALEKSMVVTGRRTSTLAWLGYVYAVSGDRDRALDLLDELESLWKDGSAIPFDMVIIHTGLGDLDEALRWVEKSFRERNFEIFTLETDPMLAPLRNHAEYTTVSEGIGFPTP